MYLFIYSIYVQIILTCMHLYIAYKIIIHSTHIIYFVNTNLYFGCD